MASQDFPYEICLDGKCILISKVMFVDLELFCPFAEAQHRLNASTKGSAALGGGT